MVFIIESLFLTMMMVEPQASSLSLQMACLDFIRILWHALSVRKVLKTKHCLLYIHKKEEMIILYSKEEDKYIHLLCCNQLHL